MRQSIAYFGVFTAFALIVGYIESLIPFFFGVPGMKLGLTNIVILIALYAMGAREALILNVARIVLVGFLFGNLSSIAYSLAGGLLSLAVMALLKKSGRFSVGGVSIAGGVSHNIGQLIVAILVVNTSSLAYYLPALLAAGVVTGFLIGLISGEVLKRLPKPQ